MQYKDWQPAISAEDVYKNFTYFSYLTCNDDRLFWVEGRPAEKGRHVIVCRLPDGSIKDLTPAEYSARSRVYEYGGCPFVVNGDDLYFVNFNDQRLYWQNLTHLSKVVPLTPEKNSDGSLGKYMDLTITSDGKWLAFAYEKEVSDRENPNYIGLLDVANKEISEPKVIAEGKDFYKRPLFSKCGRKLAWQQWSHPYMPWDATDLIIAEFDAGELQSRHKVEGGDGVSVGDHAFGDDGALYFTMDKAGAAPDSVENFYNIYQFKDQQVKAVTNDQVEYRSLNIFQSKVYATKTDLGRNTLHSIGINSRESSLIDDTNEDYFHLTSDSKGNLFAIVGCTDTAPKIMNVSGQTIIKSAYEVDVAPENIAHPERVTFPTSDGETAYGYLYLPKNKDNTISEDELPPVRVLLHGGPTGRTSSSFSISRVFWTSQGYAVFEVDYRGSIGYGRQYRDALLKKWGLLEVEDVKHGLEYLRKTKRIGDKAFVSGGSAGGYSVQRLLTYFPELFDGGASHFGIGSLVTLQKLTHKFESKYLYQLIGGTLEDNLKEYEDRSPINHLDKLAAPMIIFQGDQDKVVPPENSREIAEILEKRGVYHEYYEYKGEGHGFLNKENMVDTLVKEAAFFKKILRDEIKV